MTDFGTALDMRDGLPKGRWTFASGVRNLANAVYRRVTTPRGSLLYAPDYGRDIRDLLGETASGTTLRAEEQAFAREVEKDERVSRCTCTFRFNQAREAVTCTFLVETAAGPFRLVLLVDQLSVTVLEAP